jgi:hypothetical protein
VPISHSSNHTRTPSDFSRFATTPTTSLSARTVAEEDVVFEWIDHAVSRLQDPAGTTDSRSISIDSIENPACSTS